MPVPMYFISAYPKGFTKLQSGILLVLQREDIRAEIDG